jgi:UDP-N-acetylglucosamine/UDP-N-acetylgalactosamine diphosphorylase
MGTDQLRQQFEEAGQGQVFKFWSQLSESERVTFAELLGNISIDRVNRIYQNAIQSEALAANPANAEPVEPLPAALSDNTVNAAKVKDWETIGLKAIAGGEVGVLLMAGGQGTRLGSSAPKGCYDIGLPSHKSLFQYQAERIARIQTLAEQAEGKPSGSVVIPWYVMTSGPTRKDTEAFFTKHSYFGLDSKNVVFFEQGICHNLAFDA